MTFWQRCRGKPRKFRIQNSKIKEILQAVTELAEVTAAEWRTNMCQRHDVNEAVSMENAPNT